MSLFLKKAYVACEGEDSNNQLSVDLRFFFVVHFAAETHSLMRSNCTDGMFLLLKPDLNFFIL